MLQEMREYAKGWLGWTFLFIICVPFALWGVGEYFTPSNNTAVAEVNDTEITEAEFREAVQMQKQRILNMLRTQNFDFSSMEERIRQDTLQRLVQEEVIIQNGVNQGMRISDGLLATQIAAIPSFQIEGKFSTERYEQVLRSQGHTPASFEAMLRREMLIEQARLGIQRSALFTATEEEKYHRLQQQQRHISYLTIPATRFEAAVSVTDAEIETFFSQNAERFKVPEKLSIEYVELTIDQVVKKEDLDEASLKKHYQDRLATYTTPGQWQARHILLQIAEGATPEKIAEIEKKGRELLEKIKAGEDFAELAKQFSDDPGSKTRGGDLGFFSTGQMVEPFENAVKTLKKNEVSDLVRTRFGFHIIQLLDEKPAVVRSFEEVRAELQDILQKEQAESAFHDLVEQFATLAFENPNSLDPLVETLKLEKKTTGLFERDGNPEKPEEITLLTNAKIRTAAFSDSVLKERLNSELLEIEPQRAMVLRVKEYQPAKPKLLQDVREDIVNTLKNQKMQEKAEELGKSLLAQIKSSVDPDASVKEHNLAWSTGYWVGRTDNAPQPQLVQEAFKMPQPTENMALYQGLKLNNGEYAILALLAVKAGSVPQNMSAEQLAEDKRNRQQMMGESEFSQWVNALEKLATVTTYPERITTQTQN